MLSNRTLEGFLSFNQLPPAFRLLITVTFSTPTPEIDSCRQTKLLSCWLELPPQQITPVHRSAAPIRKNQVFRFAILRPLPNGIENRPQDSEGIQRNAPMTSIGLSVVEFALIEALYDFNAVEMNSSPPQRGNLSDPQRT